MIPIIQLPSARIKVFSPDTPVETFSDLPNAYVQYQPLFVDQEKEIIIRNGQPCNPLLTIPLQIDRFFKRNDPKTDKYVKMITESIRDMAERPQWKLEFGAGRLEVGPLSNQLKTYSRMTSRITHGIIHLPGGQREQCNFMQLSLDREAYFATLTEGQPLDKANEKHAITGRITTFDREMRCVVNHPYTDLRQFFTKNRINEFIMDRIFNQFPWMIKHHLVSDLELDM